MTRRIRVLHVVRNLNDGGMERVVADLARTADPGVFDVHVMTLGQFGRFARDAGPHTALHRPPHMTRFSLVRPAALAGAVRRIAPNIVHAHSGTWYKTARASRLVGVPVVYTDHGRHFPDPWSNRYLDRRAARITDRVVAVSRVLGDYLVARLGVAPEKIEVVPNGIDLRQLDARLAAVSVPARDDRIVFGTVGRVERVKGYDVLLAALAQWPADAPRATTLIAGDGSERRTLEALARRLDLGDRVRFVGWVEEPERFYQLLDAFVLPSRSEGTSISLLEAMAAGRPPIATDVGGNGDVLGDELREWLVRPGDPAALVAKMVAMARSAELRRQLGAAARARILASYDLSRTAERYAEVYYSVARGAHPAGAVTQSAEYVGW